MIYLLVRLKMKLIENMLNLISFDPKDVPVVCLHFLITLFLECFQHTISKCGLEPDLRKVVRIMLFLNILPEVFGHLTII